MTETGPPVRGRLAILGAAVLFSTGGAAIKSCSMPPAQVAGLRSAVAAVALLLIVPAARRHLGPRVWPTGIAYAITLTLFVLANRATTAANAIFLQATAPFWVILTAPFLLGERTKREDWFVLASIGVGLTLFLSGTAEPGATAPNPTLGNWLGAAAGITWALTVIGLRHLAKAPETAHSAASATVVGSVLSAAIGFLLLQVQGTPFEAGTATDWGMVAFLGVGQIALAYALLTAGMKTVPAAEAALLTMAEPVLNPVWTYIVHAEQPAGTSILGGAIVLGALGIRSAIELRRRHRTGRSASVSS